MIFIWGKKAVYRKVGHVADFCPICRTPRPFEIKRVGSASHLYYISIGEGTLVGFERTCQECGTVFGTEPSSDYASVSKQRLPFDELVEKTFPNLVHFLEDRLALEERIRRDPSSLTADHRHALIRDPFLLLSPKVEKRFESTHIDLGIGLAIVAAVGMLFIGPSVTRAIAPDQAEMSAVLFFLLGMSLVVWQIIASGPRFMNREVIPVLAGSLRPLRPSEKELVAVLAELKQLRHKMASKLKPADLLSHWQP